MGLALFISSLVYSAEGLGMSTIVVPASRQKERGIFKIALKIPLFYFSGSSRAISAALLASLQFS
jgi:hypothetical protein